MYTEDKLRDERVIDHLLHTTLFALLIKGRYDCSTKRLYYTISIPRRF